MAWKGIDGDTGKASFYESNPTYPHLEDDSKAWQFSSPAAQGMYSAILDKGLKSPSREKTLLSVLVVRNNSILAERYFHGGGMHKSNNIHFCFEKHDAGPGGHSPSSEVRHLLSSLRTAERHLALVSGSSVTARPPELSVPPAA